MRELFLEEAKYVFKRRKQKQNGKNQEYETKDYNGGLSFSVKESQIDKWRTLLILRYFGYFGGNSEADVKLWRKIDPNRTVLEEKLSINNVGTCGNKSNKQLTITTHRTTAKILIQGQRKNEWIEKEMEPFKEAVQNSNSDEEAVKLFERKMGFNVPHMTDIMREAEVSALAKQMSQGILHLVEESQSGDEDGYATPTDETIRMDYSRERKEVKKKNTKMIQLAAATPGRKNNLILSKTAQKRNNEQVENNSNAIELLEMSLMQAVAKLEEKNEQLENTLKEVQLKYEEEITSLALKNNELTSQLNLIRKDMAQKVETIQLNVVDNGSSVQKLQQEVIRIDNKKCVCQAEDNNATNQKINTINVKLKKMEDSIANNATGVRFDANKVKDNHGDVADLFIPRRPPTRGTKAMKFAKNHSDSDEVQKLVPNADVVLLMDSNRHYIDHNKFWYNHTCAKVKAGNTIQAMERIEACDFRGVKHAILHVGTNDVESRKPPDLIANEIIQTAMKLKEKSQTTAYVSLLPPRSDHLNSKTIQVNEQLKKSMPESIKLIDNGNLDRTDLYDKKHIKERSIRRLVSNMKDAIRASRAPRESQDGGNRSYKGAVNHRSHGRNRYGRSQQYSREQGDNSNAGSKGNFHNNRWDVSSMAAGKEQINPLQKKFENVVDVLKNFVSAVNPILIS